MTPGLKTPVTLRCTSCGALNRLDLSRAGDRPRCGECSHPFLLDRPVKVDPEDFQRSVLESSAPVIVYFYADWCAPCRMLAPYLDRIASSAEGRVLVAKVDTDAAPELAARYAIRSIPTVVLFQEGTEVRRSRGIEPDVLEAMARSDGSPV